MVLLVIVGVNEPLYEANFGVGTGEARGVTSHLGQFILHRLPLLLGGGGGSGVGCVVWIVMIDRGGKLFVISVFVREHYFCKNLRIADVVGRYSVAEFCYLSPPVDLFR